jgi:DNA (cytosine-5)-methyltransferase 1
MSTIISGDNVKNAKRSSKLNSLEVCAGAGGQALGLEQSRFDHTALVELEPEFCHTLRLNRPNWNIIQEDLRLFKERARHFKGIDVFTGGLPCPPFSVAGKQLGEKDERNLFPDALEIIAATDPKAVMIENVRGFLSPVFADYRQSLRTQLSKMGYTVDWKLLNASDFGVPQLRPRVVVIALKTRYAQDFNWPTSATRAPTVGETLRDLMAENNWSGADDWANRADSIAPTIVGGSKKHGGPDLGPTRAKNAWRMLGVDGMSIAETAPPRGFAGAPKLTVRMVARLQGFPDDWKFAGTKTAAYRQVGNAFPPPVARAVSAQIRKALGA